MSHFYLYLSSGLIIPFKEEEAVEAGEGDVTPLQYSCLENSMDGGAW